MAKHVKAKRAAREHPEDWDDAIKGRCNFRSRKINPETGKKRRCRSYPMSGRKRCRKHINKAREGPESNVWKGGTSRTFAKKYLPRKLIARYNEIVNDPELTSVRDLIAVTGARLSELYEKIPPAESGEAWDAMGEILDQIETSEDLDEIGRLVSMARENYKVARHERGVWREIFEVMEQARKLSDTERRREEGLQANLTAKQAIALFNALFVLLSEEIADAKVRWRVGQRLEMLIAAEAPGVLHDPTKQVEEADYEILDKEKS